MKLEASLTEAGLAGGLPEALQSPTDGGLLVFIVARPETERRQLLQECHLTAEAGIPGDRWDRSCTRRLPDGGLNADTQLTLMNTRILGLLAGEQERWPLAGDNLLLDLDLSQANLPAGQRLRIGQAVIEVSAHPHTGCAKFSRRFGQEAFELVNSAQGKLLRLRGALAQVVQPGRIRVGDPITKL